MSDGELQERWGRAHLPEQRGLGVSFVKRGAKTRFLLRGGPHQLKGGVEKAIR